MKGESRFSPAELALAHAWLLTRPKSRRGVLRCRTIVMQLRDVLQHGPSTAVNVNGASLTKREYDTARPEAITVLRERCHICGRCAAIGIESP